MATQSALSILTEERLSRWRADFHKHPEHQVIANAIWANGINAVSHKPESVSTMGHVFSLDLPTGSVTHQKHSGRCWMFAGLNVMRQKMAQKFGLKDFELSQSYLMFYDKLEKAHYFLTSMVETVSEPLEGRLVAWLLASPMQDGGQWDMFVNLIKKYGVVPKTVMPESFHSSDSMLMNRLLTAKLREDAVQIRGRVARGATKDDLWESVDAMTADIYRMLVRFLGEPPEHFDFEYRDDQGGYHGYRHMSPTTFYDTFNEVVLDNYISVINAPTPDKPYGRTYTVDFLGNVVGGQPVLYLNLPIQEFKDLALAQLQDNNPVWFGCDVGKMSDRQNGILDPAQYQYDDALGVSLHMTKAERLMYGESQMTHAMVLTGVNVQDGHPNRWKVENSWGDDVGDHGYFVMSDAWFDEYMYQVVIDKGYLTEQQKNALREEPIHLNPWDPMGSLA